MKFLATAVLGLLAVSQVALADGPDIQRNVGNDGIPVIKIRGDKQSETAKTKREPTIIPSRKAFRVYDLEGDPAPAKTETKVVVLSSPPPIAPNYGGFGFFGNPWYGPDPFFYGGFGNFYFNGFNGYNPGYYLNYQNPPVNYQNPPVNYQNPPVNYQNPPVNYQSPPINYQPIPRVNFYPGRCR